MRERLHDFITILKYFFSGQSLSPFFHFKDITKVTNDWATIIILRSFLMIIFLCIAFESKQSKQTKCNKDQFTSLAL